MRWYTVLFLLFCSLFLLLGIFRFVLPSQLDDVTPGVSCDPVLFDRADVFFVVPQFSRGFDIANDSVWCSRILSFDKELALHGVFHEYREFSVFRDVSYVGVGVDSFVSCFNITPSRFKPPQVSWSSDNAWMFDRFDIDLFWNQVFHKVYHCDDSGLFPNWFIRLY